MIIETARGEKMGDRISISFVFYNGDGSVSKESVTLFSQCDGLDLVKAASRFVKNESSSDEPCFTMVEFIRSLDREFDVYLGRDARNGDNSDNGHYRINVWGGSAQQIDIGEMEKSLIIDLKRENSALKSKMGRIAVRLAEIGDLLEDG